MMSENGIVVAALVGQRRTQAAHTLEIFLLIKQQAIEKPITLEIEPFEMPPEKSFSKTSFANSYEVANVTKYCADGGGVGATPKLRMAISPSAKASSWRPILEWLLTSKDKRGGLAGFSNNNRRRILLAAR